jgi:hypothetical protein
VRNVSPLEGGVKWKYGIVGLMRRADPPKSALL